MCATPSAEHKAYILPALQARRALPPRGRLCAQGAAAGRDGFEGVGAPVRAWLSELLMSFSTLPLLFGAGCWALVSLAQLHLNLPSKLGGNPLSMKRCRLFADYVFLDAPERIRMAEIPHEYLITQLQFLGDEAVPAPSDPNGTRSRKYSPAPVPLSTCSTRTCKKRPSRWPRCRARVRGQLN